MVSMTPARIFHSFIGGEDGAWCVERIRRVSGEPLPLVRRVSIGSPNVARGAGATRWTLQGGTSHERYVTRAEKTALASRPAPLSRAGASRAALIPIRKSPQWWALAQDERRDIMEAQSRHISVGLKYLPAIARRLYRCRDMGDTEPFDFLTWFEFAASDESAFDELLALLRASHEWAYVDREVDIRLTLTANSNRDASADLPTLQAVREADLVHHRGERARIVDRPSA
jgi:hypothetical protein